MGADRIVVVAWSGGLDTSYLVARLAREPGTRVVAVTVDTNGLARADLERLGARATELGAARHVVREAGEEVFERHVAYLIKGNVWSRHEPLPFLAERAVQARHTALVARAEGSAAVFHGAWSDASLLVLIESAVRSAHPGCRVFAPVRDEGLSREQIRAWLEKEKLLPPEKERIGTIAVRTGLWGTRATGGGLDDPWDAPDPEAFPTVPPPDEAIDLAEEFDLEFEAGVPRGAWGARKTGVDLIRRLNEIGRRHGIGRRAQLGDSALGLLRRVAREEPAVPVLLAAHEELERLVLTRHQRSVKAQLALVYAQLLEEGLHAEPALRDIEAAFDRANERVSGTVRVRLYRGNVEVLGVRSPAALVAKEPERGWDARDAGGFARVHAMPSALAAARDARLAPKPGGGRG